MYCQSCGAPMTLYRDRDYFLCEYCGSYYFPNPSLDGLRVLGDAPNGLKCPVCRITLQIASFDEQARGYHCLQCRGILLNRFAFRDVVTTRRTHATESPAPVHPLDRSQLTRRVACPQCARPMGTHPYYGPGNIVIDTCDPCNLIWLDGMELQRVINAPGADRGSARRQAQQKARISDEELLQSLYAQEQARNRPNRRVERESSRGIDLMDLLRSIL